MIEGQLRVEKLVMAEPKQTRTLDWKTLARPEAPEVKKL
jgi:hypothetical protein